jgi:cell division initiation protein
MTITALDIQQQSFATARHGYDPTEVDVFLERLAGEVDTYNRALSEAQQRLKAADDKLVELKNASADTPAPVATTSGVSEDIISKAFIAAQQSAEALKEEARKEAEKLYRDAEAQSREIVRDALAEKQRILSELDRLRESSEKFRTEYQSLIAHFQADASQKLESFSSVAPKSEDVQAEQESLNDLIKSNDAAVEAEPVAEEPKANLGETAVFTPEQTESASTPVAATATAATAASAAAAGSDLFANDDYDDLDIEEID